MGERNSLHANIRWQAPEDCARWLPPDGRDPSIADERCLTVEKDRGIIYVAGCHKVRFFEPDWTFKTMREAGLIPRFAKEKLMPGRGLVIAINHASHDSPLK